MVGKVRGGVKGSEGGVSGVWVGLRGWKEGKSWERWVVKKVRDGGVKGGLELRLGKMKRVCERGGCLRRCSE